MNRFFGREEQLAAIEDARKERLVTLLGPPGIGKTRLARRYVETRRDASVAYFCDVTAARGAGDLAATVARALDVRKVEDVAAAIADAGPICDRARQRGVGRNLRRSDPLGLVRVRAGGILPGDVARTPRRSE